MRRRHVVLGLLVAVAAAVVAGALLIGSHGSGSSSPTAQPADDPVVFLKGIVGQIVRNDYAGAWLKLHPAQRRIVSQRNYVSCELQTKIVGHLESLEVVRAFDDLVLVAGGDPQPVKSKVVTFRLRLSELGLGVVSFTHSVHAVAVGGRWTWILTPHRYQLYRSGGCSQSPVPGSPS
jgi:hypothetical protein